MLSLVVNPLSTLFLNDWNKSAAILILPFDTFFAKFCILWILLDTAMTGFIKLVKSLAIKSPPKCTILSSWGLENFMLAYRPFVKSFRIFETCLLDNKSFSGKLQEFIRLIMIRSYVSS